MYFVRQPREYIDVIIRHVVGAYWNFFGLRGGH